MKIDPESITVIRPEPPPVIPRKRVAGYRLKDDNDYYFQGLYSKGELWCPVASEGILYTNKNEAYYALENMPQPSYHNWRIVKVVKISADDCYFAGILQGKKNLALEINDLMEKHHTGSNADTLNAIEAFLQDYLK